MKRLLIVGSICGAFLLGGAMAAVAQDEHRDDHHDDAKQEEHHDAERREVKRIDDAHFRAHFGSGHHFAIKHVTIVEGRPQFAYSGYTFQIVQVWPAGWSYNDNCYIDFINGEYFLFDLAHPGIQISIVVI
jgi:hypothetical protein